MPVFLKGTACTQQGGGEAFVQERQVYVPAWSDNGGINDRFALLHPASASLWKFRLNFTLHHCLESPIHSETFTKDFADYEGFEVRAQMRCVSQYCRTADL